MALVGGIALLGTTSVFGAQLATSGYDMQIENRCEEGELTCDRVSYLGVSRSSGRSMRLTGATRHAQCADGVTPCRFLGNEFRNGEVRYFVSADGMITVTDGSGRVLLHEQGTWHD